MLRINHLRPAILCTRLSNVPLVEFNNQTRSKKKKRFARRIVQRLTLDDVDEEFGAKPLYNFKKVQEEIENNKHLYKFSSEKPIGKKPVFKKIIFIRDTKIGLKGESISLLNRQANRFMTTSPPSAVLDRPAERLAYLDQIIDTEYEGDKKKFDKSVVERREKFNKRLLIERCVLKFQRYIAGNGNEFYFPVSKRDIVNRLWNVAKVPVKEEDVTFPGSKTEIKRPGHFLLTVNMGEEPPARLRLYLTSSGNTWEGLQAGHHNSNRNYKRGY
ncbi:hypothetical protein AKO1_005473 [Acrasis kona]|uniref:Uncharacterized protein n=1 Tax=Acrasis kona TaxID=1008807 RepID=A0AAW2YKW7_9EUKA